MPLTVECKKRPEGSKPNALRRSGLLPANLYGHNGTESVSLVIETRTVESLLRKARINDTPISLKITDGEWTGNAVIKEVQTHPAKGTLYHLSFFSLGKG